MSSCAAQATRTIVRRTSPIERSVIDFRLARNSRSDVKNARAVEERRQDGDEHEVGRQLDLRNPGYEPEREPAEDEQDRVRNPHRLSGDEQPGAGDEEGEENEAVLVGEHQRCLSSADA